MLSSILPWALAPAGSVVRVAIDCSFGSMMTAREHKSLAHQLIRSYGANIKAETPVDLMLSGLETAAAEAPLSLPHDGHFKKWTADNRITLLQPPAAELFGADAIWLSPDADEILPTPLSREHVYVISGLIDRSVIKGASLKRAEESGAQAYRLPIREHAKRSDTHPIMALPAMVSILADLQGGAGWPEVLEKAIPRRHVTRRELEEAQRAERRARLEAEGQLGGE